MEYKKRETNEQTKQKQNHRQQGIAYKRVNVGARTKWVKGVNYMAMGRNQTFGSEHAIMHTDIKIIMLYT